MPSDFIYAGIVLVILSLILQFLHLVLMSLFPKPDKKLRSEFPEKYEQEIVWDVKINTISSWDSQHHLGTVTDRKDGFLQSNITENKYPKPTKMAKKYETKMIVENGLAIAILFKNLLVAYVIEQPIKSYDYINCKFY